MSKQSVVKFHDVHEVPLGCLSVLSPHTIVVRHQQYPSVHHFFLCQRFAGSPVEDEIRNATSLWEVDKLVKRAESMGIQREDWDRIKTDVMLLGNYYKFKQNSDAQTILLQTGNKTVVDHTATDAFWGDGGDGSGKNLMGIVLMAVRKRLLLDEKNRKKQPTSSSRK
jgi:N-glycosidase YbiA